MAAKARSFRTICLDDGFVPGANVVSIDVGYAPSHPDFPDAPQPTGLRVEWQASGCDSL